MQNEVFITNDVRGQYFVYRILLLGIDMQKIFDAEHEVQGVEHYTAGVSGSMGVA